MVGVIRDRAPYERTGITLNQDFLDECYGDLTNKIVMVVDIDTGDITTPTIYVSDRNHYVGNVFYVNRVELPTVARAIGEFLRSEIDFSGVTLDVSNAAGDDAEFGLNKFLEGGANYNDFTGKNMLIRVGINEDVGTFFTLWQGTVRAQGGVRRTARSVIFNGRNNLEDFDNEILSAKFSSLIYTLVDLELRNKYIPVIYGDWSVNVGVDKGGGSSSGASIEAFIVNKSISSGSYTAIIAGHALKSIGNVYLLRNSVWSDITASVIKDAPNGLINIAYGPYQYQDYDKIYVKCQGKETIGDGSGVLIQNPVEIAKDMLEAYGGVTTEINTAKFTYAASKISGINARAYIDGSSEYRTAVKYASQLLQQVRIELFVNIAREFDINLIYFDEFDGAGFKINDTDMGRGSIQPRRVETHFFNRALGQYNYDPMALKLVGSSDTWQNTASVTQIGRIKTRFLKYPNLYIESDVNTQVQELLKITSAGFETIDVTLTWRSLLQDLGAWLCLDYDNAGLKYEGVPCQVREISINPRGFGLDVKLMSFQMIPFTSAANPYNPGYSGIVAGEGATIDKV